MIVELAVTACLIRQPLDCIELREVTGWSTVADCEDNALILVAGLMLGHLDREATWYACELVPEWQET